MMMRRKSLPAWHRRAARASVALQSGITTLTFLFAYGLLHLLHVAGIDVGVVARWISIPLFAHAALATAAALVSIAAGRALVRAGRVRSRWLPGAFIVGPGLFALAIVLFP